MTEPLGPTGKPAIVTGGTRGLRVIITGAGGFVGKAVARDLAHHHDVVGIDRAPFTCDDIAPIIGDLCDAHVLQSAFSSGCDAVIHLATIPGGAAEADPALARQVNIDSTMTLIDAAAQAGTRPRFVFASSIAVLGDPLPAQVDDATPVAPTLLYGAHKAMIETWIATQTRRGAISGLSLRLPGIIARPRGPSGMKSAFMSDVFHALVARRPIVLPVSPEATMWLMSLRRVARNLVHALGIEATGAFTLPAIRTSMRDLVDAIADAAQVDAALATHMPDPGLESAFGRLPPLSTPFATALGFAHDGSLAELVASALATLA